MLYVADTYSRLVDMHGAFVEMYSAFVHMYAAFAGRCVDKYVLFADLYNDSNTRTMYLAKK